MIHGDIAALTSLICHTSLLIKRKKEPLLHAPNILWWHSPKEMAQTTYFRLYDHDLRFTELPVTLAAVFFVALLENFL